MKNVIAPKWVCALSILVGVTAFGVQCAIDIFQFTRNVADPVEWWTQVWQAALPTGFTVAFSAFGGCLLYARAWVSAAALYVFVALVMAVTASNGIDYLANSTVAKTVEAQRKVVVANDIAAIQTETAKKERQETLDTLWRTYTVAKKSEDKEKVLGQIKGVTDTPLQVHAPVVEEVKMGGGAILKRRFGMNPEIIQEVRSVAFPVLILIGKSLAITLGFAFWPKVPAVSTETPANPADFPPTFHPTFHPPTIEKKTKEEALSLIRSEFPKNRTGIGVNFIADRCGVSRPCARSWLRQLETEGHVTLAERQERFGVKPTMYVKLVKTAPVLVASNNDLKASA